MRLRTCPERATHLLNCPSNQTIRDKYSNLDMTTVKSLFDSDCEEMFFAVYEFYKYFDVQAPLAYSTAVYFLFTGVSLSFDNRSVTLFYTILLPDMYVYIIMYSTVN